MAKPCISCWSFALAFAATLPLVAVFAQSATVSTTRGQLISLLFLAVISDTLRSTGALG